MAVISSSSSACFLVGEHQLSSSSSLLSTKTVFGGWCGVTLTGYSSYEGGSTGGVRVTSLEGYTLQNGRGTPLDGRATIWIRGATPWDGGGTTWDGGADPLDRATLQVLLKVEEPFLNTGGDETLQCTKILTWIIARICAKSSGNSDATHCFKSLQGSNAERTRPLERTVKLDLAQGSGRFIKVFVNSRWVVQGLTLDSDHNNLEHEQDGVGLIVLVAL
ncbi:uncharacterized protein F5891DRAFT_974087 [Suillus fuscotomentosus]|uniref:Uncharacterized protein n=1 Tax=Suillus fuscotomentosus TaxID=1912939 RepID=A0AAD4EM75_9AGAM|nr:uncharacterized protein F5891DRAFT_974087 [Suillus fuscotomentosus]KAG1908768.1 hypothetical protein F5891DRAFT_974087 [Suillus fuscotomentosus]